MGDKQYRGVNTGNLKKITSKTGGRVFFPKTFSELPAIFADMSKELRSQYVVSYARTSAGPVDHSKMKIRVSGASKDASLIYYGEYLTHRVKAVHFRPLIYNSAFILHSFILECPNHSSHLYLTKPSGAR